MKMIIDYSKFQRELVNLSWAESSNELLLNILRDSEVLEGDRNMEEKVSIFPSEINRDAKLPIPIEWIIELQDIVVEILSSHDIRDPYSLMFKSVFEK